MGPLAHATVLIEIGWLHDAEQEIVQALDEDPDDLTALSLFAKAKHIQGELSQAIACWAQLYARSPLSKRSGTQLAALHHLADDPERSAGEFIALGQSRPGGNPAGVLALEAAFRLYNAHQREEASARCEEIAAKYQLTDQSIYKLAMLARAWIVEMSGNLIGAGTVLEAMGRDRSFATDTDRLLALARVYERTATPDKLRGAIKIYRYLEGELGDSRDRVFLLSRLSSLHQWLGDEETAEALAAEYLALYRSLMHRPSFADTVRVASRYYIHLEKLQGMHFWSRNLHDEPSLRERAIARALDSNHDGAIELLEGSGDVLDIKYLADLYAIDGNDERAAELYLSALAEQPGDLAIVGRLLAMESKHESLAIESYFRNPQRLEKTRQELEIAIRNAPLRPSLWNHLATLHRIVGDLREAQSCVERATVLIEAARQRSHPVGRALAASVYHFIGQANGLIHEIWAHREPTERGKGGFLPSDHILGNLTAEMKQGVRNTFFAIREYARTKFPHQTTDILDYNYTFKVPKEDEPSGGLSAGLPSALAFLSVFLQRPVPQDLASSGMLVSDAHDVVTIRRVGEAEHKVDAAYHRNLRCLLLPSENEAELVASARVAAPICDEIVEYVASFDAAVVSVFGENVFVQS